MLTPQQKWGLNNKEKRKEIARKYYLRNKDKINKYNRENPKRHSYWNKYNKKRPPRTKEEQDEYYQRYRNRIKQRNLKLKIICFKHYSKSEIPFCACCGEKEINFLTIDHLNECGIKHRKSIKQMLFGWLIKNNFPEGYQVLCMNCNFAKGRFGVCPHQSAPKPILTPKGK